MWADDVRPSVCDICFSDWTRSQANSVEQIVHVLINIRWHFPDECMCRNVYNTKIAIYEAVINAFSLLRWSIMEVEEQLKEAMDQAFLALPAFQVPASKIASNWNKCWNDINAVVACQRYRTDSYLIIARTSVSDKESIGFRLSWFTRSFLIFLRLTLWCILQVLTCLHHLRVLSLFLFTQIFKKSL